MYGHMVPTRLDVYMNTTMYPIEVPGYALNKHPSLENGDLHPMFTFDKNALVQSRATVAMMIDFADRVIPFKILDTNDIFEIDQYLSIYIRELNKFDQVPEAVAYVTKARHFSKTLQRSVTIISKSNPDAIKVAKRNAIMNIFEQANAGSEYL